MSMMFVRWHEGELERRRGAGTGALCGRLPGHPARFRPYFALPGCCNWGQDSLRIEYDPPAPVTAQIWRLVNIPIQFD
jgi:hypothetical protein